MLPVYFGMPVSPRAKQQLVSHRSEEDARLEPVLTAFTAETRQRIHDIETLQTVKNALWPRNPEWSDDEYRLRQYIQFETELNERKAALNTDRSNITERAWRKLSSAFDLALIQVNDRQRELMQGLSIQALDNMTGWLETNSHFSTKLDVELTERLRAACAQRHAAQARKHNVRR